MARIGVALSGGGSKGAFIVGALKVIDQILDPQPYALISGTSTGALAGSLLAVNDMARLEKLYTTVENKDILTPHHALIANAVGHEAVFFASAVLGGLAVYDTAPLQKLIDKNIDFDAIKAAANDTRLIYTTVNVQSGRLETYDNKKHGKAKLKKALLASASQPVLMDPVTIDGKQFVDGGVREFLPLRAAFRSGVQLDHIIAISTAPLKPKTKGQIKKILDMLVRTIDLLDSEVGNDDYSGAQLFNAVLRMRENARALGVEKDVMKGIPRDIRTRLKDKRSVPVTFLGPKTHLPMDSLEFSPAAMKDALKRGVQAAKEIVPRIEKILP